MWTTILKFIIALALLPYAIVGAILIGILVVATFVTLWQMVRGKG